MNFLKFRGYINVSERRVLLIFTDAFLIAAVFSLTHFFANFEYLNESSSDFVLHIITLILYFNIFGQIFQLYSLNVSSSRYKIVQSLFLTSSVTTLFYVFTPILSPSLPEDRMQILFFYLFLSLPILLWRFSYTIFLFSPKYFKDIVVISHSSNVLKIHKIVHNDNYHNVLAYVSDENIFNIDKFVNIDKIDLMSFLKHKRLNEIVLNEKGFSKSQLQKIKKAVILYFEEGISIKSYEAFYEESTLSIPEEYLSDDFYDSITINKNNDSRFYDFFHRTLDIIISLMMFIVFLILLPVIVIINFFANRGPIFYTQKRVGQKGKVFKIIKLRTMVKDAEKDGIQFTVKNDKRITLFGKFLRNTRIDEIPQFINIFRGDMSIIGPRPERPEVVKVLEEDIPLYALRHVIKPGLTGWAQVCYPYAGTTEQQKEKLRYDLYYVKKQSPFLDFKIIIKTFTTILFFKGQ